MEFRMAKPNETLKRFLFRKGDGNEGNFPRFIVSLTPDQSPFHALAALLANEYIARTKTRRHILSRVETDGDAEYGVNAVVYEGPKGERAFDAAWLTASLEPLDESDLVFYKDRATSEYTLRQVLDNAAYRQFKKDSQK
jgi:hypothetical protein